MIEKIRLKIQIQLTKEYEKTSFFIKQQKLAGLGYQHFSVITGKLLKVNHYGNIIIGKITYSSLDNRVE